MAQHNEYGWKSLTPNTKAAAPSSRQPPPRKLFQFYTDRRKIQLFNDQQRSKVSLTDLLASGSDLSMLEDSHSFIQWLFPTFNQSQFVDMKHSLTMAELESMRGDPYIIEQFIKAYVMMLNFYGLQLTDVYEGTVALHPDEQFSRQRFAHLSRHGHNRLRITRILIALGHFNLAMYQSSLIDMLRDIAFDYIGTEEMKATYVDYWSKPMFHEKLPKSYKGCLTTNEAMDSMNMAQLQASIDFYAQSIHYYPAAQTINQ